MDEENFNYFNSDVNLLVLHILLEGYRNITISLKRQ